MKDKNRCLALSPGLGWRCELRRGHIDRGVALAKHRAAWVTWSVGEGPTWVGSFLMAGPNRFFANEPKTAGRSTTAAHQLAEWWRTTSEAEIEQTVSKAVEYGSTDLIDIGRSIARVAGREVDDQQAALMGVFFYLEGKLSRWRSALERGDQVSDDTLLDIGVYARMAQRIQATGGWPGVTPQPLPGQGHAASTVILDEAMDVNTNYSNRSAG